MAVTDLDIKVIFCEALERPPEADRGPFLDAACRGDAEARARVEALLQAHAAAGSFLGRPALAETAAAESFPPPIADGPGTVIGPYKLLEPIGEGGMGTVYMAEQVEPVRRRVALKLIKPGMDSKQVIARFEAERQVLALMDHPNIAGVLDAGTTEAGRPYFVMDLVKGLPVTDYCDRASLPVRDRLELFTLICRAVQHAHQKGVIHRDLKPSNVLVTLHDGVPVPKVIDFGIAKATGQPLTDRTLFTGYMQLVGTPLYMSPEQADPSGLGVDTRSDVYSLGVLLYELLTGTTPLDRETFGLAALDEIRRIIREQDPPTPSSRLSTLGGSSMAVSAARHTDPRRLEQSVCGELDWIVMRSLEKDRRRRYESVGAFAADVRRHLDGEAVEAHPPSSWYRFGKLARRNRAALTTAGVAATALLLGTAASTWQAIRATRAEQRAEGALEIAQEQRVEAETQRRRADTRYETARRAVDEMYTEVAEEWLAQQPAMTPLQEIFLRKALAFYQEFAENRGDDPEIRLEAAEAAARVGKIRAKLGQRQEAADAYRRSEAALRALVGEFPEEPEYRRRLADALSDLGGMFGSLGRNREAEAIYREALEHREALVAISDEPDYRLDLATGHHDLASLLEDAGHPDQAEQEIRLAIALLGGPTPGGTEPSSSYISVLDSEFERHLGVLLGKRGRYSEAEGHFRRSLTLREALAADDPASPLRRRDLSSIHLPLGHLLSLTGRPEEAEHHYRKGVAIDETLAGDFPRVPAYRDGLASNLNNLSILLKNSGRLGEAEQLQRRALEFREGLVEDFPDVPSYHSRVGGSLHNLASVLEGADGLAEASRLLERAIGFQEAALQIEPHHPTYLRFLRNHHSRLAGLLVELEVFDGAASHYRRTVELNEELIEDHPDHPDLHASHGCYMNDLAILLSGPDRSEEARRFLERAVEHQRIALGLRPGDTVFPSSLRNHLWNLAAVQVQLGDHVEAARTVAELHEGGFLDWPYEGGVAIEAARQLINCAALAERDTGLPPECREATARSYLERARPLIGEAVELGSDVPECLSAISRVLATAVVPEIRDPGRALEFARRACEAAPEDADCWTTLALARSRGDDWDGAIAAASTAIDLRGAGDAIDRLVLAVSHARRGEQEQARTEYHGAIAYLEGNEERLERDDDHQLKMIHLLRDEATTLLGLEQGPDDGAE